MQSAALNRRSRRASPCCYPAPAGHSRTCYRPDAGALAAAFVAVVSSLPACVGFDIAAHAGIPSHVVQRRDFTNDAAYSAAIFDTLAPHQPDLIVLAGFLRRLVVPPPWRGRILNIHPALLPDSGAFGRGFFGERVHAAVLATGAAESGAAVHVVDAELRHRPGRPPRHVPVHPGDTPATLAARVFATECRLYPAAISAYLHDNPWILDSTE